jgi:hypothetical protein
VITVSPRSRISASTRAWFLGSHSCLSSTCFPSRTHSLSKAHLGFPLTSPIPSSQHPFNHCRPSLLSFCIASLCPPSFHHSRTSIIPLRYLAPPTSPLRRSSIAPPCNTSYCPKVPASTLKASFFRPWLRDRLLRLPSYRFSFIQYFWYSFYTTSGFDIPFFQYSCSAVCIAPVLHFIFLSDILSSCVPLAQVCSCDC